MTQLAWTNPPATQKTRAILVFAHGAGAGSDSPFMTNMATRLAGHGVRVARFDFPYMVRAREEGKRRPPDRAPKLLDAFQDAIAEARAIADTLPLLIGGKSMGGRMASLLLAQQPDIADGLIIFGYPFHPPGKPEKLRTEHFTTITKPVVINQGSRDAFGGADLITSLKLPKHFSISLLEDGNHDLKPRKASGFDVEDHLKNAAAAVERLLPRS